LKRQAIEEWSLCLQEHWSVERLMYAKLSVRLSTRRWKTLMDILFRKFDDETTNYVPLKFMCVPVPQPPGRYQFVKLRKLFRDEYGFERIDEGVGAALDLLHQIRAVLLSDLKAGLLFVADGKLWAGTRTNPQPIELLFTFDGFGLHNKAKLIAFSWKVVNAYKHCNNSPWVGNHYMLLQHSKEDARLIRAAMGSKLDVVARLIKEKKVELEIDGAPAVADLTFAGANDIPAQAAQNGTIGVSGCCS
jgi:hypothetical protein